MSTASNRLRLSRGASFHGATKLAERELFQLNSGAGVIDVDADEIDIDALGADALEVLQAGNPDAAGARVIIAAGTGLGQGAMVWQKDRYVMLATEGGHADFAPRDELEVDLLRYLLARHGQVSYQMILSGRGLMRLYEFLRDSGCAGEPVWLMETLRKA